MGVAAFKEPAIVSAEATTGSQQAYRSSAGSFQVAWRAKQASADLELARIERYLSTQKPRYGDEDRRPKDRTSLTQQFLGASARSLGMSAGALVWVIGHSYFGAPVGDCGHVTWLHFRLGEGPAVDAWRLDTIVDVALPCPFNVVLRRCFASSCRGFSRS